MNSQQLLQNLHWRYATKQFDSEKKISPPLWEALEESLLLTPSSFGLQPWHFIVITDQEVKNRLVPHSWGQQQVADCSHFLVLASQKQTGENEIKEFIADTAQTRGTSLESLEGYKELMSSFLNKMDSSAHQNWAQKQAYIALGQVLSTAAHLQIDACPMEGILPHEYDRELGLAEQNLTTTVACAFGYRSQEDPYAHAAKVRFSAQKLITHI